MRQALKGTVLALACCALFAFGQDEPSLGDAARQARQQKQQKGAQTKDASAKDGQGKDNHSNDGQGKEAPPTKAQKVITNDEIPERSPVAAAPASTERGTSYSAPGAGKVSPEQWKSMILAQKNVIASIQSEVEKLNDSIRFAPANCVANCVQWNQRQREKQQEVERMQAQLDDQKKRLEDMQESARRQGYGSSVYDP